LSCESQQCRYSPAYVLDYAYVNGNPVSLIDPKGEFGVVGALVGASIEIGKEMLINKKPLRCVDIGNVVVLATSVAFGPGLLTVAKSGLGMSVVHMKNRLIQYFLHI